MAGDWIAIEHRTVTKTEVGRLIGLTGRSRHEVLGLMLHFWIWAERETIDGKIDMPLSDLPVLIGGDTVFWESVVAVGWLELPTANTMLIPRADNWLTKGAKARLTKARRAADSKATRTPTPKNDTDALPTEENRTEESPKGFLSESESDNQGRNGFLGNRSASRPDSVFNKVTDDTLKFIAELRRWFLWQATVPNRLMDTENPDNWTFCVAAALQAREATVSRIGLFAKLMGSKGGRKRVKDKFWAKATEVVRDNQHLIREACA